MEPSSSNSEPLTRKERRRLRRSQRHSEGQVRRRGTFMRLILLWGGTVLVLVGIGWFTWQAAQRMDTSSGGTLAVPVSDTDNVRGPIDAPVTLVEYSDFQCPGCAAFHPVIQQVLNDPELVGKVRFVYRHFPLVNIHINALPAARATQAAAQQDKFWEMHDAIFDGQSTWSNRTAAVAQDIFAGYAEQIGMDVAQWEEDMDSDVVKDKVDADIASAQQSSVNSTPSFFMNGIALDVFAAADVINTFRQSLINAVNANP